MDRTLFNWVKAHRAGKLSGADNKVVSAEQMEISRLRAEYVAGLLRYVQAARVAVLEVTAPDSSDWRRRGKDDDLDAQNAAHAAFVARQPSLRARWRCS